MKSVFSTLAPTSKFVGGSSQCVTQGSLNTSDLVRSSSSSVVSHPNSFIILNESSASSCGLAADTVAPINHGITVLPVNQSRNNVVVMTSGIVTYEKMTAHTDSISRTNSSLIQANTNSVLQTTAPSVYEAGTLEDSSQFKLASSHNAYCTSNTLDQANVTFIECSNTQIPSVLSQPSVYSNNICSSSSVDQSKYREKHCGKHYALFDKNIREILYLVKL